MLGAALCCTALLGSYRRSFLLPVTWTGCAVGPFFQSLHSLRVFCYSLRTLPRIYQVHAVFRVFWGVDAFSSLFGSVCAFCPSFCAAYAACATCARLQPIIAIFPQFAHLTLFFLSLRSFYPVYAIFRVPWGSLPSFPSFPSFLGNLRIFDYFLAQLAQSAQFFPGWTNLAVFCQVCPPAQFYPNFPISTFWVVCEVCHVFSQHVKFAEFYGTDGAIGPVFTKFTQRAHFVVQVEQFAQFFSQISQFARFFGQFS